MLQKLRAYPVLLREVAAELAKQDARVAAAAFETLGAEVSTDSQAIVFGQAVAALNAHEKGTQSDPAVSRAADFFESVEFNPGEIRKWVTEVMTVKDINSLGGSVALSSGDQTLSTFREYFRKGVTNALGIASKLKPIIDFDAAWRRTGDAETISPARPSPAPSPRPVNPPPAPTRPPMVSAPALTPASPIANFTLPLHINVSLGFPALSAAAAVPTPLPIAEAGEAGVEAVVVDQDYSTRPGYDPAFLEELEVPLPRLAKAMEADTAVVDADSQHKGDPFELAYYHYSVYMNKRRRTAWFSAANVDGDNRPNIGKRQGDRWYIDTRISRSEQLGQEAFESGIDRGHLTRREDTAWGDSVESATAANNDTFHFANCSLQASAFNRGKDRWQGLEQFLLEQHAKKDKRRMIVITGPLFGAHDPVYKNDRMNYSVRCPLQFWKVCVLIRESDSKPSATAFILGQDEIKDLPGFEEAFDVAATQITIAELEKQTGLDFGDLRDHDHFAQTGPGTLESPPGTSRAGKTGQHIGSFSQIHV